MSGPLTNGRNGGRDGRGRFSKGQRGWPRQSPCWARRQVAGRAHQSHRRAGCEAIASGLIASVKVGDVAAAKMLLSYTIGQPQPADLIERMERLEETLEGESGPMSIQARLRRVEALLGNPASLCPECGYPANAAAYIVLQSEDELFRECDRCGRTLRPDGKPIEGPLVKVYYLAPGEAGI